MAATAEKISEEHGTVFDRCVMINGNCFRGEMRQLFYFLINFCIPLVWFSLCYSECIYDYTKPDAWDISVYSHISGGVQFAGSYASAADAGAAADAYTASLSGSAEYSVGACGYQALVSLDGQEKLYFRYSLVNRWTTEYPVTVVSQVLKCWTVPTHYGTNLCAGVADATEDSNNGQDPNIFRANCGKEKIADPISILNGNNWGSQTDIQFNSAFANGFVFERFYNSRDNNDTAMGYGWRHSFLLTLTPDFNGDSELIKILDESGRGHYFQDYDQDSIYVDESFIQSTVIQDENGIYIWKRGDGRTCTFDGTTGRLIARSDPHGNTQNLSYDSNNRLEAITDQASGRHLTFHYSSDNRISYITGPVTTAVAGGIWVSYEYDDTGNLTKTTYADGNNGSTASGFEYRYEDSNDPNNMTAKYDLAGHLISSWSYDDEDRAVENVNREGSGVSINFDDLENVVVTDAYELANTYTISKVAGQKRITTKTGASNCNVCSSGIVRAEFDDATGLPTEREWANGRIDQYQDYDSNNNPGTWIISSGTDEEKTLTTTWHPTLSTPLSRTQTSLLADDDNPDRSRVMIWDYDDPSADGDTDAPNENPANNIHRIILQGYTLDSAGSVTAFEHVTTLTYNSRGQISSVDGPNSGTGDTVVFDYDSSTGNLLLVTSPVTGSVQFTDHDNAGNPGQIVDANDIETVLTYDGRNRLLTAITDGKTESRKYTAAGLIKSLTDRAGRTLQYEYNSDYGLPATITNPAGEYVSYAYDINYNLISETLSSGQGTRTWYLGRDYGDPVDNTALSAGKPWKTMVPNQADTENLETEYEYTNGNLTKIIGPSGSWTEYEYDTLNRIIKTAEKINDTQNAVSIYGYDTMGNLNLVTDPEGLPTTYTYDDAGRIVKQVSPETGTTTYSYDEAGNLKTRMDNAGQIASYDYDAQYRLTGITYTGGNTRNITCTYDQGTNGMGKITGISDPSGTTSYTYDTLGRRTSVATTVGSVTFNTAYAYDDSGKITSVTYPGGRVVTFTRNATGNISSVATSYGGITQTLVSGIAYEPFGPVKAATFSNGKTEARTHDAQYRPGTISVPGSIGLSYTYNLAGNVASMTDALAAPGSFTPVIPNNEYGYVTDSNKLSSLVNNQGSTPLSHDANGNITAKGDLSFEYFPDNRLSTVKQNSDVIAAYEYNASGLRTQKTAGSSTTLYHYDLNGNLICETSVDGTVLKEYLYLDNLPLAMIIYGNSVDIYFYHTNHLDTPVLLTDSAGQTVWKANYYPFGKVSITVSTVETNLRFPGQYFDGETGLHYNWHRYYDPVTGRYITPDPIGLAGGINPFVYALNDPVNMIDPDGLIGRFLLGQFVNRSVRSVSNTYLDVAPSGRRIISVGLGGAAGGAVTGAVFGTPALGMGSVPTAIVGGIAGFSGGLIIQTTLESANLGQALEDFSKEMVNNFLESFEDESEVSSPCK